MVDAFYRSLARIFPAAIAAALMSEWRILCAAFSGLPGKPATSANSFTYATTGPLRYVWLIALIGAVPETWLLHLLLPLHRTMETILIAMVAWSLVHFAGSYHSMRDHPHTLEGDRATLRFAFRRRCEVPLTSIVTIKTSRLVSRDAFAGYRKWERFCINHSDLVELTLSPEAMVEEFTGERYSVARLAVSFDDAQAFTHAVERSRKS